MSICAVNELHKRSIVQESTVVYEAIVGTQSNNNKNDVDDVDSFVDGVYLACWLRNRFSSTPAVLDSFYQVALSL